MYPDMVVTWNKLVVELPCIIHTIYSGQALTSISCVKHLRPGFLEKYDNSPNFGLKAGIFTIKG